MVIEASAGTPAWHAARRGMLTASRVADALAVLKNGKPAESRLRLAFDLAAERMTGIAVEHYVSPPMQWGIDNQAGAVDEYEIRTGLFCGPEVFVLHPTIEFFGATPDATVGDDGLLEIKCPQTSTHLRWVNDGVVPEQHRPQLLAQLACTRRKWVDFMSFDPRIQNPAAQCFVRRFEPTGAEIEQIENGAREFLALVDAIFQKTTEGVTA